MPHTIKPTRRAFLAGTAIATATLPLARTATAETSNDEFRFEVVRTEEEWLDRLSKYEFQILRKGGTEWPRASELWNDFRDGEFACRGCDLHLYSSKWREKIDKGWVFFAHAQPNAILTGIDEAANYSMQPGGERTMIESHCRRCGSHLGHILVVERKLVHCINGASLVFTPATT